MSEEQVASGEQAGGEQQGGEPPVSGGENWVESIQNEELRGMIEKKGYKTPEDVAEAYRNMVKLHGRSPDVIGLPDSDDDADGWNQVYSRLGRPDTPDNYAYEAPEGLDVNEDYLNAIRAKAHEVGISQKQFEALAAANDGFIRQTLESQQKESSELNEEQIAALKKDFGGETAFNEASQAGLRAAKALGLDEGTLDALDSSMGVAPVMKLLATIGKKVATEDQFLEGIDVDGKGMSQAAAKAELNRLKSDAAFQNSLVSPMDANHKANLAKWQDLQRVAFGG